MISKDGPFTLMEELASLMVKPSAGWGAVARPPDGRLMYHVWPGKHNRSTSRVCMGPESTPTTPLGSRVLLRRFSFVGPHARGFP